MKKYTTSITMLLIMVSACILSISLVYAEDIPSFSFGAFGGIAVGITGEAVEDYDDTEWEDGTSYGGSVMYRMANGFVIELLVEQFEMKLEENSYDIVMLKATPILLMIGYQSKPNNLNVAFHATIGGGVASSDLDKETGLKDLERYSGVKIDISNDDAFMFGCGAGIDYFFTRNIALTLGGLFIGGNIDSKWDYNNGESKDFTLKATNIQGLVGIRLWI